MVEHTEVRSFGQMRWIGEGNSEKILHLRFNSLEKWEIYSSPKFRHIRQADTVLKGMGQDSRQIATSKGYRTAQRLLTSGWKYA